MGIAQSTAGNFLLKTMGAADYTLIEEHLRRIQLPVRLQLHEAGRKIDQVYFPEDGIVSIVAVTHDGKACEVGLFGREGMSETASVLGTDYSPHEAYVQVKGMSALKLPRAAMNDAMDRSPTMRLHLLKYVQTMMVQLSSTIAASTQTIEQRLSRWLLMCHDRSETDLIPLTQEFVGMMLGVRRAGVTDAMLSLSGSGFVVQRRGSVTVIDRQGLELLAAGSYGLAETEYERLIGVKLCRNSQTARPPGSPVSLHRV